MSNRKVQGCMSQPGCSLLNGTQTIGPVAVSESCSPLSSELRVGKVRSHLTRQPRDKMIPTGCGTPVVITTEARPPLPFKRVSPTQPCTREAMLLWRQGGGVGAGQRGVQLKEKGREWRPRPGGESPLRGALDHFEKGKLAGPDEGGQLGCNRVTSRLASGRVHPGQERFFLITFPRTPTVGQPRSSTSFRRLAHSDHHLHS